MMAMIGKETLKICISDSSKAMCMHSIGVCPCAYEHIAW